MSRRGLVIAGLGAATVAALARRRSVARRLAPPIHDGPVAATEARDLAAALLRAAHLRRRDLAMDFAPAAATSVEPLLHGRRYFPRMLEDIEAARDHVHLLIYGYKPGDIGTTFRDALAAKVAEGVEVRLQVDAIGSEVDFGSKGLFRDLRAAGVEVVAHDGVFVVPRRASSGRAARPAARGRPPLRPPQDGRHRRRGRLRRRQRDRGPLQGRALLRRHVPGDRARSWRSSSSSSWPAGATRAAAADGRRDLDRWFPPATLEVPADAGCGIADDDPVERARGPATTRSATPSSSRWTTASERIDIVNPYISNRAILAGSSRPRSAASRSGSSRPASRRRPIRPPRSAITTAGSSTPGSRSCSTRRWPTPRCCASTTGCFIGGCNLDDLSLFRNDELDLLFEDPSMPALAEATVFDELAAMSVPAAVPTALRERLLDASMDRVSRLL